MLCVYSSYESAVGHYTDSPIVVDSDRTRGMTDRARTRFNRLVWDKPVYSSTGIRDLADPEEQGIRSGESTYA